MNGSYLVALGILAWISSGWYHTNQMHKLRSAAEKELRAVLTFRSEAEQMRTEAALARQESETSLAEALRLRDEAGKLKNGARLEKLAALDTLAAAEHERSMAREKLGAAKEASTVAVKLIEDARQEWLAHREEVAQLAVRQASLKQEREQAQAATAALSVAKQEVLRERALLREQQTRLQSALLTLRQQITAGEVAVDQLKTADQSRIFAAVKRAAAEAVTRITVRTHQAALTAHAYFSDRLTSLRAPGNSQHLATAAYESWQRNWRKRIATTIPAAKLLSETYIFIQGRLQKAFLEARGDDLASVPSDVPF